MRLRRWLRGFLTLFVLIVIVSMGMSVESGAVLLQITESDWPMLMHDPRHSGYTEESLIPGIPTGRLNVKWKVGLGERIEIEAQPIVAYGYVYIGVMNGKFHAIDADTGQIAWTFQAGGAVAHTAAAADGKVYFGCEDGKVYALDANTGECIWSYQTGGPLLSSPAVVDHALYIGSFDTHLYALESDTGNLRWRYQTGGRVWTSPAVVNNRVYLGSEDMYAYCLDAASGGLIWKKQLSGVSMRNTYPVVSNGVAVFTTVKPGVESYMPWEDLKPIQGLTPGQVVDLWNDYYQQFPERRYLFYVDADTGEDKWDPINKKYVPFPLPYWGLIIPLVDSGGFAWFPASGGGGDHTLDHNFRLWKVSLADGTIAQAGSQSEYMMQFDETGTHTMGGGRYYQTAQMNVGMFDPVTRKKYHIYGGPGWPYGEPLDPTPTIHRGRYAGAGWSMWSVPASSPLVIANGVGYYTAYSWLYALTSEPVAEPGAINLGIDHTLGPPHMGTYGDFVDELNWRVEQIIASGPLRPQPLFWGWIHSSLHSFWLEGEAIASLAGTMPYLRPGLQEELKAYLKVEATTHLFQERYTYHERCLAYGENDVGDPCDPHDYPEDIIVYWFGDDMNVIAENLYAMWAYAHYTGDWQTIIDNWDLVTGLYGRLVGAFDSELGFYVERNPDGSAKRWHTPDFKPNLQIAAMMGVSRMAECMGDTVTQNGADSLLQQMYWARVKVGEKVQSFYDEGVLQRVDSQEELEYYEIMPYQGYRDRDTDVRQVYWTDDERWEIAAFPKHTGGSESGVITDGLGKYSDLIGYRPLFPELGTFLQGNLRDETAQYVQTVTNLNPWWYWNDASHCMQISGEDLYNPPHLSAAIFQAKAYILGEDFYTLKDQLPWEYTEAGFRDIYRLQNLVALLQAGPRLNKSVSSITADSGDVVTYTISLAGTGATAIVTDTIPSGTAYVPDSAHIEPQIGTLTADSNLIHWAGVLTEYTPFELAFAVTVNVTEPFAIVNTALVYDGKGSYEVRATTIANGLESYLPVVLKGW